MPLQTIFPSNAEGVAQAAARIRAGELVAFPTETVYGLGANALDDAAVRRIFEAKGRPATSPLIVHAASLEMAREFVAAWPPGAEMLARRFWPGPLTLVLEKRDTIPDRVTAGLPTVGIRVPSHPVALALIKAAGVPIAAPSANPFTGLSPTTAQHVARGLGISFILDGGPSLVGIESTVVSLVAGVAALLRPGMISRVDIEALIGPLQVAPDPASGPHSAPGQHRTHYSPSTPLLLVSSGNLPAGRGAYLYYTTAAPAARALRIGSTPAAYAAQLYALLHQLDQEKFDWIAVEAPPPGDEWAAIADRLGRAARP